MPVHVLDVSWTSLHPTTTTTTLYASLLSLGATQHVEAINFFKEHFGFHSNFCGREAVIFPLMATLCLGRNSAYWPNQKKFLVCIEGSHAQLEGVDY